MDDVYARYREALRLGHQDAAEGHFAKALAQYQVAADVAADRALPYIAMGGMHIRLGHAKEALAVYEQALELEPENLDALTGRTAALLAAGRRDEAARSQQQMLQSSPTPVAELPTPTFPAEQTPLSRADTLHAAGEMALQRGNTEAAIDAFLAEAAEHAGANRLDAALDAALGALSVSPAAPRTHLALARLYFRRGWIDKGVERALLLDRMLALQPDPEVQAQLRQLAAENAAADERLIVLARRPA